MDSARRIKVIDSHTEGEPTRVVIDGLPKLIATTFPGIVDELRRDHDGLRSGIVCEPRGHEAIVGAYLLPASAPDAHFGVIFFNNQGYLGMCGHGTIGLVATLAHMGKMGPSEVRIETPVGCVTAMLHDDGRVSIGNVRSYRYQKGVSVPVDGYGEVVGDIAYGGNWFFLADADGRDLSLSNLDDLSAFTSAIRRSLDAHRITGEHGALIDHVEIFGPPQGPYADSRNFVLCPGLAYDRSPCGTGLSAKLACLAADHKLEPGETWRQESVIGSRFEGQFQVDPSGEGILPIITGRAWITGESTLIFDESDPFGEGIVR